MFWGDAPPTKSVNFVVAHDGFTLADLVAYNHKHNEANGEENRDGSNDNNSWNHGVEGPTRDIAILAKRQRDMRNLLALNVFARGVPMLAMGSETGHSQQGNNNAYAQQNALSWLDWSAASPDLTAFVGRLTRLRNAHPALKPLYWLNGGATAGYPDVEWRDEKQPLENGEQWGRASDVLIAVFAAAVADGVERAALVLNRGETALEVALPEPRDGYAWRVKLDTSNDRIADAPTEVASDVLAAARSTLLLIEEKAEGARVRPAERADINALAFAVGIAPEWTEISGKRTVVSIETKLALLEGMRLDARSHTQAKDSLSRLTEETRARRIPPSLTLALDAPRRAPLRSPLSEAARDVDFRIELESGTSLEGKARIGEGERVDLPDGGSVLESRLELPELPIGRHQLAVAGVSSVLTIAPPECFGPKALWRRRFGISAQLYALRRRERDEGIGGFGALGDAAAAAGAAGAAYVGVSPLHVLFAHNPSRASPYHPSDRRFLNPLMIDVMSERDGPGVEASSMKPSQAISACSPRTRSSTTSRFRTANSRC